MRQELLLPVEPWYIVLTIMIGFLLGLVPFPNAWWVPDFLALVLVFWLIFQPHRVGIFVSWLMGILVDVHRAAALGENAMTYTLMAYFALMLHQRIRWFGSWLQALHILPILFVPQLARMILRMYTAGESPSWSIFSSCLVGALLWPIVSYILFSRQRRAIAKDDTRPI